METDVIASTVNADANNLLGEGLQSNAAAFVDFTPGVNDINATSDGDGILLANILDPAGLQDNGGPTETIALIAGSPALNAGDNTVVTSGTDPDGNPRIVNDVVDIGALEACQVAMLVTMVIDLDIDGGLENSLLAKLDAAQKASDSVAINLLQAFINSVESHKWSSIQAT